MSWQSFLLLVPLVSLFAPPLVEADDELPRMDSHGDPLPPHAVGRLGSVRFVQGAGISSLAYSPDGKLLAAGEYDECIVLWDTKSGRKTRTLKGHPGCIDLLAFSPDNKFLVSSDALGNNDPPELRLWNVATGKQVVKYPDTKESVKVVGFFPDGKTLATAYTSGKVRLWDTQTGKLIRVWSCGDGEHPVLEFAFAPNGKVLAVAGPGGRIRLWDMGTGKALQPEAKTEENCNHLAFSPDSTSLAVATGDEIHLYRASTLAKMQRFGKDTYIARLAFSQDGKTLANWGMCGPICLWDVASGKQIRRFPEKSLFADTSALAPDGKTVASVGRFGEDIIQLWDAQTGGIRGPSGGQLGRIEQVAFLADGATVVATVGQGSMHNAQVVVWPNGTAKESRPVPLPLESWNCRIGSDRSTLAVATDDGLRLLKLPSGRELLHLPWQRKWDEGVFIVDVSADNKRALVVQSHATVVWDLSTKKILHRFDPKDSVWGGFSPDGQKLLVKLHKKDGIFVWNLDTNLENRHWVDNLELDDRIIRSCYSPDGKMFVILGSKDTIRLLETATGKERLKLPGAPASIADHNVAFSANGTMLAVGFANGTVRLYDVRDGKQLQVFAGHLGPVTSVNFSPDGSRLVSGSEDTTALLWEIPVGYRDRKPELAKLGREERDNLWETLANADAAKAYAALQILAASPAETVSLCKIRLFETPPTPPEQIQRWISQLDKEEFAVREQGSRQLERLGRDAGVALEKALQGDCSPEMRRRIEVLLETLKGKQVPIRVVRAVELLEQIGTAEAVDVLRQLEKKTGDVAVREDVRRSLGRLAAKQKAP